MLTPRLLFKLLLLLCLSFISLLCPAQHLISAQPFNAPQVKPYTLVFKLKPDYELAHRAENRRQIQALVSSFHPKVFRQKFPQATSQPYLKPGEVDLTLIYEVEYPAGVTFDLMKRKLLGSGLVEYVEQVNIPAPLLQPNDPYADSTLTNLRSINQYYLKKIQAYRAWEVVKGDSSIVIGILDTGIRLTHEDLRRNIRFNYADPIDGKDNDQDGYVDNFRGWDMADNDNNPTADNSSHGVTVSGIAGAVADNGKGLAGVAFNCKILPVKVYPSTIRGAFAGYEGIVYAADHGCHVINLSWGNPGIRSAYEQDIINYAAINKNVVIVAAAGNSQGELQFYPASYDNVISVASTDDKDQYPTFFTNSTQVDLLAPGIRIYTTGNANDTNYTFGTGTSFSAPIVAGCAALVRKRFPQYNALQVAEQLRMTADEVYGIPNNTPYRERLGRGRVNLLRAVTETNLKAVRNFNNLVNKGRRIYPGDTLRITGSFRNILAPVNGLAITLTVNSPHANVLHGTYNAGALATMATTTNTSRPFEVYISPDIPTNTVLSFRYGFSDGTYTDYQYFQVVANPDYLTLDINELDMTITSKSNIGFNGFNYAQGEGVIFRNSNHLLSEGGFMIGSGPGRVSDNIRNAKLVSDADFFSRVPVHFDRIPKFGDQSASGLMQDSFPVAGTVGVKVSYRAFAWKNAPDNRYVMVEYKITNNSQAPLTNLYAGLFSDWDIGGYTRNAAAWDSVNTMGYVYNVDQKNLYAGVKLLTPLSPTHYAIDNAFGPFANITLADGFTDAEKYQALSNSPRKNQTAGFNGAGNDVSDVVGAKIPDLPAGASYLVTFAILAGESLADLQASAAAAQRRYQQLKTSPTPIAKNDTICPGATAVLRPGTGSRFKFYADAEGQQLLSTGATFTTPALKATTTYYVSNADSLYESSRVPFVVAVNQPRAAFRFSPDPVPVTARGKITFTSQTPEAVRWHWDFGDESQGNGPNPTVQYRAPGTYQVTLTVTDKRGCTDTVTKSVEIAAIDFNRNWSPEMFLLYPNPTPENHLNLYIPPDIDTSAGLDLEVLNLIGEVVLRYRVTTTGRQTLHLTQIANGMYLLRIRGRDGIVSKRFQLLRD